MPAAKPIRCLKDVIVGCPKKMLDGEIPKPPLASMIILLSVNPEGFVDVAIGFDRVPLRIDSRSSPPSIVSIISLRFLLSPPLLIYILIVQYLLLLLVMLVDLKDILE